MLRAAGASPEEAGDKEAEGDGGSEEEREVEEDEQWLAAAEEGPARQHQQDGEQQKLESKLLRRIRPPARLRHAEVE